MRISTPLAVLAFVLPLVLTSPLQSHPPHLPSQAAFASAPGETPAGTSADFLFEPNNGVWLRFSPPAIRIRFLNETIGCIPANSNLRLDGAEQSFAWSDSALIVETVLDGLLEDGIHQVDAVLAHGDGSSSQLSWTFGLDTRVPDVQLDPIPSVTDNRTLMVRGLAVDSWLQEVLVLGRPVPVDAGMFSSSVVLWPGLNDLLVEARDLAGNLGRQTATVELQVPEFGGEMDPWVVNDSAFSIDIPRGWTAQENIRLPSGYQADFVAVGPLQSGLQTEIIVDSEYTTRFFSETTAFEWVRLLLATIEASGQLKQVVASPRLLDIPGTVAVKCTFLRETASQEVAFVEVMGVWSQALGRHWSLMAATDEHRALDIWPALSASVASFRVIGGGTGGTDPPDSGYVLPTALVIGAIFSLVAIAGVAMFPTYRSWRKKRDAGRWRPPRDWGF